MKKKLIAIGVLAAAIILLAGVYFMLFGKNSAAKKEMLISFSRGSSGDMQGRSSFTRVQRYDDTRALITVSHAEWHYEDPQVIIFVVVIPLDISILT